MCKCHNPPPIPGSYQHEFPFKWIAHFRDGSTLNQFEPDGRQHIFDELWAKKDLIDYIRITGIGPETCIPLLINFPEGADPIIFERVRRDKTVGGGREVESRWIYFGYKHIVGERVQKVFVVINRSTGVVSIENTDEKTRS